MVKHGWRFDFVAERSHMLGSMTCWLPRKTESPS
jgi:hypothetical protein